MALRLLVIAPKTQGGNCLAAFVETESGDVLFQGWTEMDPSMLDEAAQRSPLAPNETLVRFPARMRKLILEALCDQDTST
ncbi:hypothetical protein [Spirillospora sp. CA-294931]|uniref:hypothetical protein n=1 Tax=Spirillospora sp. CA-294931 TaxID=3240042 RepID=UPI003D8EE669